MAARSRWLLGGFAAAGLIWRLALAFPIYNAFRPGTPAAGDADLYLALAENLGRGRGYTIDPTPPHDPFIYRPPAYPLFLAGVLAVSGGSHQAVLIVHAVLDLATGALLFLLARRLWPDRPERPLVVFALWATCPAVGSHAGRIYAEVLATFLVTGGVLGLAVASSSGGIRRLPVAVLGGAALMLAALARPQLVPAVVSAPILALAFRHLGGGGGRRTPGAAAVIAFAMAGILLVEAPWVIRNQRVSGEPVLLASGLGEVVLALGVLGEPRGDTKAEAESRLGRAGLEIPGDFTARGRERGRTLRFVADTIREHPFRYLAISLRRAVLLWVTPRTAIYGVTPAALRAAFHDPRAPEAIAILLLSGAFGLYYLGLLGLAALGALRHRGDRALWAILLALPIGVTAITMWLHLQARYVVPTYPAVVLAAALPLSDAFARRRRGSRHDRTFWRANEAGGGA